MKAQENTSVLKPSYDAAQSKINEADYLLKSANDEYVKAKDDLKRVQYFIGLTK